MTINGDRTTMAAITKHITAAVWTLHLGRAISRTNIKPTSVLDSARRH